MDSRIPVIIPARGGSKEIPNKNIINLLGKPLLVHSIEYALSSEFVDDIFVSTDDSSIAEIAMNCGTTIINRPTSISGDSATTESAISHVLSIAENKPDIIVLLQPTSPFRPKGSLNNALKKFINGNYDSLLSISQSHKFDWKIQNDIAIPNYDYLNRPMRQDILTKDKKYFENGSLYIFKRLLFESTNNRLGGKIGYIVFDAKYSHEIDSYNDLELIKILMKI